jgi:hypothetical protein
MADYRAAGANRAGRNPKFEFRNPKQIRNSKEENFGWAAVPRPNWASLRHRGMRGDFGFRYSDFGFPGIGPAQPLS